MKPMMKAGAVVLLMLFGLAGVAGADDEHKGDPVPALIAFGGEPGAVDRALNVPALSAGGRALLDAVRSDPLASDLRVGMTTREALAEVMSGHALSLPAPRADGRVESLAFVGAAVVPSGGGMISLYAADRAADTETALVVDGLDVLGSFRSGRDIWYVRPLGEGRTAVYRYDTARLRQHPPGWRQWTMKGQARMRSPARGVALEPTRRAGPSAAPPVVAGRIDIIGVYTDAAATQAGNIRALIQLGVDSTNRAWEQSGVGWLLRLVGVRRVDYTEEPERGNLWPMAIAFGRLLATSDNDPWDEDPDGYWSCPALVDT